MPNDSTTVHRAAAENPATRGQRGAEVDFAGTGNPPSCNANAAPSTIHNLY